MYRTGATKQAVYLSSSISSAMFTMLQTDTSAISILSQTDTSASFILLQIDTQVVDATRSTTTVIGAKPSES